MSYSPIANAEIDASSPLTETLMTKLRDNIKDHTHGASDVAGVPFTAGDFLFIANTIERQASSGTYVKVKETKLRGSGTFRIKFNIRTDGSHTVYGKIYKNGIAVGAEQYTSNSTTGVTYTEDISGILSGDLLQVYVYSSYGGENAIIRNFEFYCAEEGISSGY